MTTPGSYVVSSPALNLRSSAEKQPGNLIAALPQGQTVLKLDQANDIWWKVQTEFKAHQLEGFVNSRYLLPANQSEPLPSASRISSIQLAGNAGRRSSVDGRAYPLDEPDMPRREPSGEPAAKLGSLQNILDFLDVERSARYQPTSAATFCNIYAYDYCYLARAYLPRVWWTDRAVASLRAGQAVSAAYGTTIREQTANQLFDWLNDWGDDFGWVRVFDFKLLQSQVNQGGVGLICAQRKVLSRSGHITVVLPETAHNSALRSGTNVLVPLQSQAGARNKKVFVRDWWIQLGDNYRETGFWYHDPQRATLS
jgi:hypothetical protein